MGDDMVEEWQLRHLHREYQKQPVTISMYHKTKLDVYRCSPVDSNHTIQP